MHRGVTDEIVGESCFDVYSEMRKRLIEPYFQTEMDQVLSNAESSLEDRVGFSAKCNA